MSRSTFPPGAALEKARAWCAYQDRCQMEVRKKLYEWGQQKEVVESHIGTLIGEDFINEERFAKSFARGKFRIKKWGRIKITMELKSRGISPPCINTAMKEIDREDYAETVLRLIEKLKITTKERDLRIKDYKIHTYLLTRGFENDLIHKFMQEDNS